MYLTYSNNILALSQNRFQTSQPWYMYDLLDHDSPFLPRALSLIGHLETAGLGSFCCKKLPSICSLRSLPNKNT